MMAWRADEEHVLHHISDPWRVSSLMWAFFELILALCVLLCAIISVTTTRLIKSSGLLSQTCASCDHNHNRHRRQGSNLRGYHKLDDSCNLPESHGTFGGRYHREDPTTSVNIICEDCTRFLSDRACTLKRVSSDDSCPGRFRCHGETGDKIVDNNKPLNYCSSDHTILWAVDDDTTDSYGRKQRRGWSCSSSFENVQSSEPIAIEKRAHCECRSCMGIPHDGGGCSPPSRRSTSMALEKKFAKVSPNNNRSNMARGDGGLCSSCHRCNSANVFADSGSSLIVREIEGEPNDDGLELMHKDGTSSRSLSDGSATHNPTRVGPEDSERDYSQESFWYNNSNNKSRSSPRDSSSRYADGSRNGLRLSIDTDLLAGESTTPEWYGSFPSHSPSPGVGHEKGGMEMDMDMEEDVMETSTVQQHEQEDLEISVMELGEALHEEQDALAALYLELDEERNAASSAAHEAMAMITRLQEEKAGIQMEARQYQRMAEEKHQYDQESMAMLQEILVNRDEEVYALEEEVHKYRKTFLTLGMNERMDWSSRGSERVGSPKSSDVLLIERETLLLEGSQDWKNTRDRRDEQLIAEIKDWLHEASEKIDVAPEGIEELNVLCRNFPKIAGNINRLLPSNGKKNLLESFSSVAVPQKDGNVAMEDSQRDGLLNEEFEAHRERTTNEEVGSNTRDSAAGYESFQGMMESLRQEPTLKDEESLETLKKIEEKFRSQSSEGKVRRTGDELRQIWKNTLRSFESDEAEVTEASAEEAGAEELTQSPTRAVEPADTSDSPHHHSEGTDPAVDVDADRSIGEKRMSVLEYVWKFEEQLHQLGNKKRPLQPTKSGLSTLVEAVAQAPLESDGASLALMDSDKSKYSTFGGDRPIIPIKTRLRKRRAADLRSATPDAERDHFVVRGEGFPSRERATRNPDTRYDKSSDFEESNQDGSSVVHDVYEVRQDPREIITEVSSPHFREDKRVSHDIKKYVSSNVNELVPGQFVDSHETGRCVEHYLFDNGRTDFVVGHTLEEHEANGKGRPDQYCSTGRVRHSEKGPGMCTQAGAVLPGEYMEISRQSDGCALQSPSSVVTHSPRTQMQDVVQHLTNRLNALETDRQILQDTIASLQKEYGGMNILQDISRRLGELRGLKQTGVTNTNMWSADDPGFVSSMKEMLSWNKLRHSVQSQLSKLVQLFVANGDPGGSQGDHQVGLFRVLHKSPLSKEQRPIERARSLIAVCAANSNPLDDPFIATLNTLVSQYSWPMTAKERSDTAFSGWDY